MTWWRRRAAERAIVADGDTPEVRAIVSKRLAAWEQLDALERHDLVDITLEIAGTTRWEAAQGFEVTDEMVLTIASHAALPVLALGAEHYRDVSSVIVHPRTIVLRGRRPGPVPGTESDSPDHLLGEAHYRGPVLLAWSSVLRQAMHPNRGEDVVIHEFAHRLDMLDGLVDGTPPLGNDDAHRRWVEVCTDELRQLREGPPDRMLRAYAATDPGEFFAVATEVFFTRSAELEDAKPALYDVLRDFYRQDPAERQRRQSARPES